MPDPLSMHNMKKPKSVERRRTAVQSPISIHSVVSNKAITKRILTLSDMNTMRKTLPAKDRAPVVANPSVSLLDLTTPDLWSTIPKGLWKNRRCFVVGGGPSLKGFDFDQLQGELTIGINRAFEIFSPTILFCVDIRVWGWIVRGEFGSDSTEKYNNFKGRKVWVNTPSFIFPKDIATVELNDLQPCGDNSGHAAINLAILLGANPIYLLGFDMKMDKKDQVRWHDGYPEKQPKTVYKGFVEALEKDTGRIKETGTTIINLTPSSALKCFKKSTIKAVLRKKHNKPLVISYYTEGTSYEKEAARLIKSIMQFGYDYDIVPKRNMGGWKKNTYYKAQFIREMLDKHPDRNLLWLDADSAMIQHPVLFDDMKEDIGVFIADWAKIGNIKARLHHKKAMTHTELISATIYLANNSRTRAVIDAWIALNKKNFKNVQLEQANLYLTLKAWKDPLTVMHLPPSYSQVFDIMAHLGEPVIEQYQAARRLKGEVGK